MKATGLGLALCLAGLAGCASTPEGDVPRGLVVTWVGDSGLAARAGMAPGDVLRRWRRGAAGDELTSPYDLDRLSAEESPRGVVTLDGQRGDQPVTFRLAEGQWELKTRPSLEADQELAAALAAGGEGVDRLRALAREEPRPTVRAWLLAEAAELAGAGADALWAEAVAQAEEVAAWVHLHHGHVARRANRLEEAAASFATVAEGSADDSLAAALGLNNLAAITRDLGDLDAARRHLMRALEIRERLAPGSLAVAGTLSNLALVARDQSDLEAAEAHLGRALAIQEKQDPGSLHTASSLTNLGAVAWSRGDAGTAESYYLRALAIQQRLAPDGLAVAANLNNLAMVARDRGDLAAAQERLQRALDVKQRLLPDSLAMANGLNNLGTVAWMRGDLDAAESDHRRALAIAERLAPNGSEAAISHSNLGVTAWLRGDLEQAEANYSKALEIRERLAPGSLDVARSLNEIALVARERGELETAEECNRRALEINHRHAPGSLNEAENLANLGELAADRGELDAAERQLRRALAIQERLAPETEAEADTLKRLARVLRDGGRRREALDALRRSVASLEAQQRRLGGMPEHLSGFRSRCLDAYRELIDLLVEEGSIEEAFAVVEGARARALLAILAERDIVDRDVPPELERERRQANADHDRTVAALVGLPGADEEGRVRLLAELDAVRQRQDEIRARVRAASPRLAELRYPEPLDLAAAQQALDPGCLLFEYSLGHGSGHLFVVGRDSFSVHHLEVGEQELREEVARFRELV